MTCLRESSVVVDKQKRDGVVTKLPPQKARWGQQAMPVGALPGHAWWLQCMLWWWWCSVHLSTQALKPCLAVLLLSAVDK